MSNTKAQFITVFNVVDQVHQIIPVDFIMAVAPLFEKSEIVDAPTPVLGHTVITMKNMQGLPTNHSLEDIHKALGSELVGADNTLPVILQVSPPRREIIIPEELIQKVDKPH